MPMDWNHLLSGCRLPRTGDTPSSRRDEPFRTPFEADYDRVVYSAPFRRLARKTQVHPMAAHDHVHNRLTHSIEVASVGRSFANRLGRFLRERDEVTPQQVADISQIVQTACLVHDIGNPPFGHAGEFAIREWVRVHGQDLFEHEHAPVSHELRDDWQRFEGNAQGFRLAARADNPATGYMRLTFASLASMIKYPWTASDPRAQATGKCNVFSTERSLFDTIARHTGLKRADGSVARHPLSLLTEAADDICYRTLDLEDAVDLGILPEQRVRQLLLALLREDDDNRPLALLRGQVIERLVDACWQVFQGDYPSIMAGQRDRELKADLSPALIDWLGEVKGLDATIFATRGKVAAELGAYETLGRIIGTLARAARELALHADYDKADFLTRRRLELAWGETYARKHAAEPYDWWLHQVMDYVAGLTDNYARQLSREIAGV